MRTKSKRLAALLPLLALLFASLNCTISVGESNDSLEETKMALAVQQTSVAVQSSGINATATAQAIPTATQLPTAIPIQPPPLPTLPPPPLPTLPIEPLPVSQIATAAPTQPPMVDWESRMKDASILVYEDIVYDPTEYQYVKRTLNAMGLKYTWDGSAIGRLKSHMLSGAQNGQPWDLVILAIEARSNVSGEYFDYLTNILNQGTSVILEAYHLDAISEGTISPILADCGVEVYPYPVKTGTLNDAVVWPLPNSNHPVVREPNGGMTFTKARDKWFYSMDLGSKMALNGMGDAQLLLGTKATEPNIDGVLAVCKGGQLIIQTFSSHTFTYEVMYPLWENYIYNALRTRLTAGL